MARALTPRGLYSIFLDSARSSASIGLIIGAALIFNYIVASERVPVQIATLFDGLDLSPLAFLLLVNLLFLALGCLLDAAVIILVIVPILLPTANALGIDLIHFGVVAVVNCMIGLITPPYGMLLFVINGATGIPIKDIIREGIPYFLSLLASLLLVILFPGLTLWLPRLFGYQG